MRRSDSDTYSLLAEASSLVAWTATLLLCESAIGLAIIFRRETAVMDERGAGDAILRLCLEFVKRIRKGRPDKKDYGGNLSLFDFIKKLMKNNILYIFWKIIHYNLVFYLLTQTGPNYQLRTSKLFNSLRYIFLWIIQLSSFLPLWMAKSLLFLMVEHMGAKNGHFNIALKRDIKIVRYKKNKI